MQTQRWIRETEARGWRVVWIRGKTLHATCDMPGCKGCKTLPLDNLGPVPEPCELPHKGKVAASVFAYYEDLVKELNYYKNKYEQGELYEPNF